ncbi:MAG: radical SAM/SPASM domain-containing protein [Myxococcales bacterium]|jgi:radical SAM protein with 4Fe4S-binding SPASM domain
MESRSLGELIHKALSQATPLSLHLLLTERCDLDCLHCYLPEERRDGRMALGDYKALLEEARSAGTLFVTLSGGEPTLRPDFFQIAEEVRRQSLALKVMTNGYGLAGELAARLASLKPAKVSVSLYGATAAVHDAITRRAGSFARTLEGIGQLAGSGVGVVIKTPLMRLNVRELRELDALGRRLGAELQVSPYLFWPQGRPERLAAIACNEAELAEALASGAAIGGCRRERMCGAGSSFAAVDPDGKVLACHLFPAIAGDLFESSFRQIWDSSALLRRLRSARYDELPACAKCELREHCLRCAGQVYARTGRLTGEDPEACRIARQMMCQVQNERH